jgi:hypothetical protein
VLWFSQRLHVSYTTCKTICLLELLYHCLTQSSNEQQKICQSVLYISQGNEIIIRKLADPSFNVFLALICTWEMHIWLIFPLPYGRRMHEWWANSKRYIQTTPQWTGTSPLSLTIYHITGFMLINVNTIHTLIFYIAQEETLLTLSITNTQHMDTYHTTFKVIYFDKTVFSVFLAIVALMMAW